MLSAAAALLLSVVPWPWVPGQDSPTRAETLRGIYCIESSCGRDRRDGDDGQSLGPCQVKLSTAEWLITEIEPALWVDYTSAQQPRLVAKMRHDREFSCDVLANALLDWLEGETETWDEKVCAYNVGTGRLHRRRRDGLTWLEWCLYDAPDERDDGYVVKVRRAIDAQR